MVILIAHHALGQSVPPKASGSGTINAANQEGTDIGMKINSAAKSCTAHCSILVPAGTYSYATDIFLPVSVSLQCEAGAILDYQGTGNAVKLGSDGITVSNYTPDPFEVTGCTFTGGSKMAEGIYVNEFVVKTIISNNYFHNFGNAKGYNIWLQGQNWDARISNNYMWADGGRALTFNGIAQNAADPADAKAGDHGQSQLFLLNNHLQNVAKHKEGIGVYVNGMNGQLIENVISGFAPNIQLGARSSQSQIKNITMERSTSGPAPCIAFGDSSGNRIKYFVDGVTISDSTCNVHNTDFGTTAHFLAPASPESGIQNFRLTNNVVASSAPNQPMVVMNDLPSQTGNYAELNRIGESIPYASPRTRLHTIGPRIPKWYGGDEQTDSGTK